MNTATAIHVASEEKTEARVEARDWPRVSAGLDAQGWAVIEQLLSVPECRAIADVYERDGLFRSRVVMARHGFGQGEYRYFAYPLPGTIAALRTSIYPHLVPLANR